jgi:hypothetical protein
VPLPSLIVLVTAAIGLASCSQEPTHTISNVLASPNDTRTMTQASSVSASMFAKPA